MNYTPALGMPGTQELIIVLVILLLLFGGKRLPQLAKGLGKSISEFKRGTASLDEPVGLDEATQPQLD
ncbi:MAG: twin-arginine translocase TatA/TatE family subunit [Acidobacteria bacterium]|nr:twin-arginine translocase TatA/TatE family subunit [Acidobacteriota bacterium]MCA1618644.1 twin-arginine translocase TatA/TatE family subunit [Acidobacteriota bacterium]